MYLIVLSVYYSVQHDYFTFPVNTEDWQWKFLRFCFAAVVVLDLIFFIFMIIVVLVAIVLGLLSINRRNFGLIGSSIPNHRPQLPENPVHQPGDDPQSEKKGPRPAKQRRL